MVAPRAASIFDPRQRRVVGILLACPECPYPALGSTLRVETEADYRADRPLPDLVPAGPLGFVARCDVCGFRVAMRGDRLPTVEMIEGS